MPEFDPIAPDLEENTTVITQNWKLKTKYLNLRIQERDLRTIEKNKMKTLIYEKENLTKILAILYFISSVLPCFVFGPYKI